MVVGQGVDHAAALLAGGHQPRHPQPGQVLADGRPGRSHCRGQGADIGFVRGQGVQEGEAGAVGQQAQDPGRGLEGRRARFLRVRTLRR